jgi:hypothetical protein
LNRQNPIAKSRSAYDREPCVEPRRGDLGGQRRERSGGQPSDPRARRADRGIHRVDEAIPGGARFLDAAHVLAVMDATQRLIRRSRHRNPDALGGQPAAVESLANPGEPRRALGVADAGDVLFEHGVEDEADASHRMDARAVRLSERAS